MWDALLFCAVFLAGMVVGAMTFKQVRRRRIRAVIHASHK
jgi:hypothetical protein